MDFGKTFSTQEIKDIHGVSTLDIIKNPKTDKLFVTASGKTISAVSKKYDNSKPSQFVELIDGETTLLCLTNVHTSNVVGSL